MIKYLLKRKLEKMFTIKIISIDKHTITIKTVGDTKHLQLDKVKIAINTETGREVLIND